MARPLRIEYEGACYHVMNRGNGRARVFHADAHYQLFLDRLGEFAGLYAVRVMAYCLMPNHFHLYVKTERANLSRFMQALLTSLAVTLNRWRGASGHVFQGRFKAPLVEDERYGTELTRYIHLNPVRVSGLRSAGLPERRRVLRAYRWSSFGPVVGVRAGPPWLDIESVLSAWAGTKADRMKACRAYVEQGLVRDLPNPLAHVTAQTILGTEGFVDRIRRRFLLGRQADRREQPSLRRLQKTFSIDRLAAVVGRVCEADPAELLRRRGPHRLGRRVLIYCACRYGRGEQSLTALAGTFGVSVSGLASARDRMAAALPKDRHVRRLVARVDRQMREPNPAPRKKRKAEV